MTLTTPRTEQHIWLRRLTARRYLIAYVLVLPVVIWRLATSIYPFFYTAYLSFFDNSPVRRTHDFVGFSNYTTAFQDPSVFSALSFSLLFTLLSVSLQVMLALLIAEMLNQRFPLRSAARAVNLLPWAMSAIVISTAAQWIFHEDYGLVNDIIWRITGERPLWLVNPNLARIAVVLTDVWKNTAFLAVIYLSGLQGISPELHEAARIDGANRMQSYFFVTMPLLMPLIISTTIFVAVFRVLTFELVYALTGGGPGTATSLLGYLAYLQAFRVLNFGYASALSMILFLVVLFIGLVGFSFLRRAWSRL